MRLTTAMPLDIKDLVTSRLGDNYELHDHYLNRTLVKVQRTIGFDIVYARAEGAYLYDMDGKDYLDFLSGFGVFNIGRNHPVVQQAIRDVLELNLPNMVQLDSALMSGLLAERLVKRLAQQGAPASRFGFSLQQRHRSGRGRAEVREMRHAPAPASLAEEFLPRPQLRLAFRHGQSRLFTRASDRSCPAVKR